MAFMNEPQVDPRESLADEPPPAAALRPSVAGRTSQASLWLIVGGALLAGVTVFGVLASARNDGPEGVSLVTPVAGASATSAAPPPPAELALAETAARNPGYEPLPGPAFVPPPLQVTPPPPPPIYTPPQPSAQPAPQGPNAQQRRSAPTLIVDLGAGPGAASALSPTAQAGGQAASGAPGAGSAAGRTDGGGAPGAAAALGLAAGAGAAGLEGGGGGASLNTDEQFAQRVGGGASDRVRATMLRNPSAVVPQGAMIPGVLETALNSDLPGFARAVVSRDVRSFDGSQVLIARGSRVIGQYRSGVAQGQSRAFIIWTRVIRPDGASIQLASSGTDPLGRAGLEGSVDRHFFQRFGGAILLSVLNAGVAAIGERPSTQVVIGSSQEATGLAAGALSPANISPTIKVPQGSPIRIFVARDLDFSTVGGFSR
jgi:type IV secretion system protein VirB10